ncbi:spaetzle domain-containing protein isoform X2 [Lycorma delicatula]|uniref:spaetzle domain-containing protein isoform X2 n=1 Tax=Lycorma delicatula TaxID=130591 RepID=UPI003F51139F
MDTIILNYFISVLTASVFLVSSKNCLAQYNQNYGVDNQRNVKFPDPFNFGGQHFRTYAEDRLDSLGNKVIRSVTISPTGSGWSAETQQSKPKDGNVPDEIVFPDQYDKYQKNKTINYVPHFIGDGPPCAQGKTFCVDADNYPRSHLRKVLQKDEMMYRSYFGKDTIDDSSELGFRSRIPDQGLTNRIDQGTEKSLCETKESVIFPKMAQNKEGNWLFIANVDNYIQGIRVEECSKPNGTPCDAAASFPNGFIATCKQKYIYRKLVALNQSGGTVSDSFRMPSCCACLYHFEGVNARSGGEAGTTSNLEPLPLTVATVMKPVTSAALPRRLNRNVTKSNG